MADHKAINEAGSGAFRLRVPLQAAPINRTPVGVALAAEAGVEASAWWDTALNIIGKAAPIVAGLL